MKIYFAGSIAGGQEYLEGMKWIVGILRYQGHEVLSGFVIGEDYTEGYPTYNAWERDIPLLQECDAVIAEISQSSFGVGIELGVSAVAFGKPVLCLRDISTKESSRPSQLITKGPFKLMHYDPDSIIELTEKLNYFLQEVEKSREGNIINERE